MATGRSPVTTASSIGSTGFVRQRLQCVSAVFGVISDILIITLLPAAKAAAGHDDQVQREVPRPG